MRRVVLLATNNLFLCHTSIVQQSQPFLVVALHRSTCSSWLVHKSIAQVIHILIHNKPAWYGKNVDNFVVKLLLRHISLNEERLKRLGERFPFLWGSWQSISVQIGAGLGSFAHRRPTRLCPPARLDYAGA